MMILLAPNEEAMVQRIVASLRSVQAPILTLEEAIAHTKHGKKDAFYEWCRRWNVSAGDRGRYSRVQLDRGLHRESLSGKSRRTKKSAEAIAA